MRCVSNRTFYVHLIYVHVKVHMLCPSSLLVTTFKLKAKCGFYVALILSFYIKQNKLPELIM
jgi:hypothetical protein